MVAVRSCLPSVRFWRTVRNHIPEDSPLQREQILLEKEHEYNIEDYYSYGS
jgi:hypothetical protein